MIERSQQSTRMTSLNAADATQFVMCRGDGGDDDDDYTSRSGAAPDNDGH
jgi:hypothetical protein